MPPSGIRAPPRVGSGAPSQWPGRPSSRRLAGAQNRWAQQPRRSGNAQTLRQPGNGSRWAGPQAACCPKRSRPGRATGGRSHPETNRPAGMLECYVSPTNAATCYPKALPPAHQATAVIPLSVAMTPTRNRRRPEGAGAFREEDNPSRQKTTRGEEVGTSVHTRRGHRLRGAHRFCPSTQIWMPPQDSASSRVCAPSVIRVFLEGNSESESTRIALEDSFSRSHESHSQYRSMSRFDTRPSRFH